MTERAIRTCRTCRGAFTKDGYGAQSIEDPKRCRDCVFRARAFPSTRFISGRGPGSHQTADEMSAPSATGEGRPGAASPNALP